MIRFERSQQEPSGLATLREGELKRVRAIGSYTSDDIGNAYRAFAKVLRDQQYFKCCYCEMFIRKGFNDVEHLRPKAEADRRPGSLETYGYWWLAWTWENLLFSCPNCNRTGKNAAFPLAPGSIPLRPEEDPPGMEIPLLIDPSSEDPIDEIQFVELPGRDGHFFPQGRGMSHRGQTTVNCLGLASEDLLDHYRAHVEGLEPNIAEVLGALATRSIEPIRSSWNRLCLELRPMKSFLALTYDVIDQRIPEQVRRTWGLKLPRPQINVSP